jgi:formamidopyrimidine-DNA glycosylase
VNLDAIEVVTILSYWQSSSELYVIEQCKEDNMPELPEVETVRSGLERYLKGESFVKVILYRDNLRFPFPTGMATSLQGRKVLEIDRRAKYLLIRLSGEMTLLSHLGMSGSFQFSTDEFYTPQKHDHVVFQLSNGSTLIYNDPRRFGVMDLLVTGTDNTHRLLHHLGPEPLGDDWGVAEFSAAIRHKGSAIKTALLDQQVVVGVGNIYACEALFISKISPRRIARTLAGKKKPGIRAQRLVQAVKSVLTTAIEVGGSTLKDFQDVDGNAGYFAHQFQVYGREGKKCVRPGCSSVIQRIVQGGRSTFFCPSCQR